MKPYVSNNDPKTLAAWFPLTKVAKNHRKKPSLSSISVVALLSDRKLTELTEDFEKSHWDIVGLSVVRGKWEELTLKSSRTLHYAEQTNAASLFLSLSHNLIERYNIKIILAYASTSTSEEHEIETFYGNLKGVFYTLLSLATLMQN